MKAVSCCFILLGLSAASFGLFAQAASGVATVPVIAVVHDVTGAVVPGATIEVSAGPVKATADANGSASFNIASGNYSVTATSPGFVPAQRQVTVSSIGQTVDFALTVGGGGGVQVSPDPSQVTFIIGGKDVGAINVQALKTLPQKTVTFHNVHTKADETYSGVPLTDLLAKYGAPTGDKLRGKAMSDYIVATGRDGYKAVLALAETDPAFHPGDVLVADTIDGKPIGDKEGPFKLVVTEDKRPARGVHNLVSIELRTAD